MVLVVVKQLEILEYRQSGSGKWRHEQSFQFPRGLVAVDDVIPKATLPDSTVMTGTGLSADQA
jgi:hypothetical protein